MQATEAVERLRHKLAQMVSLADAVAQTCNIAGMDDTISSAREVLAATATIDPPDAVAYMVQDAHDVAMPGTGTCMFTRDNPADYGYGSPGGNGRVTPLVAADPAPVGAQKEQQGNAIRPSAEPAGQLDAGGAAWISVDDRLPGDSGDVLVLYWPYDNHENAQIAGQAHYHDGGFYNDDGDEWHPPSHWMPIPAPPAEQSSTAGAAAGGITNNDDGCIKCPRNPATPCDYCGLFPITETP